MSYFNRFYDKPRDARVEHDKAWRRGKAIAWDGRWQALSVPARRAYLLDLKAPTKEGSTTQAGIPVDSIAAKAAEELTSAGFARVESASGKKAAKLVAVQAGYDFSSRLRSIHRYHLLGPANRENLTKYVKHAFYGQGETVIQGVLAAAKLDDPCRLEEGLELYVTTRRWPTWALESAKSKAARPILEALRKAPGPVKLAALPALVKGFNEKDLAEGLTDLVVHLAAFEDVDPETFELVVGLLPEVRKGELEASKTRARPPLIVCERPKDVAPPGGLEVNDLRTFLLEIAGESPRLRRDGGIFQKDESRFYEALPPHPAWLVEALQSSPERRLDVAYVHARIMKFVEPEDDDKTTWLRLSGKGRSWLAATLEEQYARFYEHYRSTAKPKLSDEDYGSSYSYGDAKFLGIPISVAPLNSTATRYYTYYDDLKPEQRDSLRRALDKAFQALPVGVFHRWDSVLGHMVFGEHNPLTQGLDPSKLLIAIDRRQVPRVPEQAAQAARMVLDIFLKLRLLPFDAVRAAVDDQGRLCIARLPRFDGYFGRPYEMGDDEARGSTRVIVQPDFSVLVIGLDPSPAAELAPFCERAGGHAGQGILTFKITRDSVIRAVSQGLSATAIVARLKKYASVDVPENILREVREWADWVRLVNARNITVVRCPDKETVARVVSVLGKKAERLSDTLVALHVPKLTPAERQKLQENGILVTKEDIKPSSSPTPVKLANDGSTPAAPKKRGRPPKPR